MLGFMCDCICAVICRPAVRHALSFQRTVGSYSNLHPSKPFRQRGCKYFLCAKYRIYIKYLLFYVRFYKILIKMHLKYNKPTFIGVQ